MTDTPSKILPNSFQTPNFFVDDCMALLTGNEYKCLSFVARKTFGWQKRSDRIAKSQIITATGLGHISVDKAMNTLVFFGLVIRVADNNSRNLGNEWALQTDDNLVRFDLLLARQSGQAETNHKRTAKARLKSAEKGSEDETDGGGGPVPQGGPVGQGEYVGQEGGTPVGQEGGGPVGQPPQKPIKAKENMGAAAPGSPVGKIEKRNVPENVGANAPETSGETSSESSRTIGESSETFSQNAETFSETSESSAAETLLETRIAAFPEETRETVRLMLQLFGVRPPEKPAPNEKGGDFALWLKSIRELQKIAADYNTPLEKALRLTCQRWQDKPFDVSHPGALKKSLTSILAQSNRTQSRAEILPNPVDETPTGPAALPGPDLQARIEAIRNRNKPSE